MIGPTDLLVKQLQANALSFLIENLGSFLFLKIIDLSINNGLINFFSTFFLNLYNFQLNVSKKTTASSFYLFNIYSQLQF